MATQAEIDKDKELLQGLGLPFIKHWPPRCAWTTKEGELRPNLPCDPYSRHLWMSRGMTPNLFATKTNDDAPQKFEYIPADKPTILQAIVLFINNVGSWEGTVSGFREELANTSDELPTNPTRMGRKLKELVSQLDSQGVQVEHLTRGKQRVIRLSRH